VGADSSIPAKRGKQTWCLHGVRVHLRADFPAARCRQRALVESVFSAAKRELSARVAGRHLPLRRCKCCCLGSFNLYCLCLHLPFALAVC
jgi:hypothetical protein